jgi:hypothetical protein
MYMHAWRSLSICHRDICMPKEIYCFYIGRIWVVSYNTLLYSA